ncbi:MAG TPA: hypothetical protein VEU95_06075 [Micropepsaceae bacterium]|nr:hypothetical protein [Micropepsaceae bacterium]
MYDASIAYVEGLCRAKGEIEHALSHGWAAVSDDDLYALVRLDVGYPNTRPKGQGPMRRR